MAALFDKFADSLNDLITNGKTVVTKEGEVVSLSPDAATLNVVRQFLKDTGTTIAPGTSAKVNDLAANLPFDGSEHNSDYAH
jgi:hypothetical protein